MFYPMMIISRNYWQFRENRGVVIIIPGGLTIFREENTRTLKTNMIIVL